MNQRVLTSALAAAALSVGLAGCAQDTETTTTESGVELIDETKLTTCTHLPYKPFQFTEGDEVVGFDVDLIDLVAEEIGVEQEIFDTPVEGIQSGQ